MTLPIAATLYAAGLVAVRSPHGWLVQTGRRCYCALPGSPTLALIAAAELRPRALWGRA